MGKITEIKFVGQPIFKQIMNLVSKVDIQGLIRKHNSDYYYKAFKTRTHLFTMLFGILSRCDSMNEICEGLRAMGGKLNHLGLDKAPAKSTACDGLRNRDSKFFEDLYFTLVKHYHSFLSDSRTFGLTFKEVLLIDSTSIRLFSNILKGVGCNPKGDGKKKGGLKVHMLIDAVQSVGRFIKITAAKVHDKNFLKSIELISHSMVVFDKAYNYYHQFALWTQNQVYFVTRIKSNAVYTVIEVKRSHYRKKGQAKVLSDEIIELEYHPEDENRTVLIGNYVSEFNTFSSGTTSPEWRGVYSGRFTYVKWLTGKEEFYDNTKDPFQLNNLVEDGGSSEIISEFRKKLNNLLTEAGDDFLPGNAYGKWFNENRYPKMDVISGK